MSPEYLVAPESVEVSQQPQLEPCEQQNQVVLDYNTKYKTNIRESILS